MLSTIKKDIRVVFERDPAARSVLEVIFCYPGFQAIINHRFAHFLYKKKCYFLARIISHFSRFITGIEIHPGAKIGEGFFIDHGGGIVIGETTEIENNVTIYQGVTLGGTGKEKGKRHPTIGNNVTISAGAKVLGSFVVGDNVKIGGGSVVLRSVPPNCTVVGVPGRIIVRDGAKVENGKIEVDLEHHMLPDPVADILEVMQTKIEKMEKQLELLNREVKTNENLQYSKREKRRTVNIESA